MSKPAAFMILGEIFLILGVAPFFYGVQNIGTVVFGVLSLLCFSFPLLNKTIEKSVKIIMQEGLSTNITIVTDNFHQSRARLILKREDNTFEVTHVSSEAPIGLQPVYWVRDMGGVVLMLLGLQ